MKEVRYNEALFLINAIRLRFNEFDINVVQTIRVLQIVFA